jgi:hypothetical protein
MPRVIPHAHCPHGARLFIILQACPAAPACGHSSWLPPPLPTSTLPSPPPLPCSTSAAGVVCRVSCDVRVTCGV